MSVALHNFIDKINFLPKITTEVNAFLREHPNVHKVILIANHIFRAMAMIGLTLWLPFSFPINAALCVAGSLFVRLTAERNAYKYALPAMAGSLVFPAGYAALQQMISGVAFASLEAFAVSFGAFIPLAAYAVYVVLTVNYDVDHRV